MCYNLVKISKEKVCEYMNELIVDTNNILFNLNEIKNIPDFQLTLKEIIQNFYNSEDFPKFSENTAKNEQNFKMNKKYEHSLLVQEEDYNDYFKMIEKDCKLTDDQKSTLYSIQ